MAQIAEIREALATLVDPIVKAAGGGQAVAYADFDRPQPPIIQVLGPAAGADFSGGTFARSDGTFRMVLQGLVGTTSDLAAQMRLDRWLSAKGSESVRAALESDQSLDGATGVWGVVVENVSGYRIYDLVDGQRLLGAEWTVRVQTE